MNANDFRVLVVDDHLDSANTFTLLLTSIGINVRAAYSGEDAIAKTVDWLPHLIFMDIGMPGMSGHEACVHIRKMGLEKTPVIVALTAWSHSYARELIEITGFDAHLIKPAKLEQILAIINALSGQKFS